MISPARRAAFDILAAVEAGGYASELLLARTRGLDSRDAGLAEEIVFGTLRRRAQLDYLIGLHSGRDVGRLDAEVRIAIRMGAYQLRHLDRVPRYAATAESVELVKRARRSSAAGLVNAVLRRITPGPVEWPDRATELSLPAWLLERWDRHYGAAAAEAAARAALEKPVRYVRLPEGSPLPAGLQLEPAEVAGCYRVVSGEPQGLRVQDIGSQCVVPLLELRPGLRFLDLCAAPGNKTAQALEAGVAAVACDINPRRLRALDGLGCTRVVLDGTRDLPFHTRFDRILVDAPCSGTGTLARNPEIKWRIQPEDLRELHALQVKLLRNALGRLAPAQEAPLCGSESPDSGGPLLALRQRVFSPWKAAGQSAADRARFSSRVDAGRRRPVPGLSAGPGKRHGAALAVRVQPDRACSSGRAFALALASLDRRRGLFLRASGAGIDQIFAALGAEFGQAARAERFETFRF